MIKEVPSKVFNKALDKWINFSMGINLKDDINDCSYCSFFYSNGSDEERCKKCPLTSYNVSWDEFDVSWDEFVIADKVCCNGLWQDFREKFICDNPDKTITPEMQIIANRIVDLIISRCVYEEK